MAITLGLFGLEWLLLAFFTPAIESTPTQASVEAARGLMVVQACTGLVLMLCAAALYGAQVIGVIAVSIVLLAAPFINVAIAESYDVRNLRWVALLLIALAVVPIGWLGVFRERTARIRFAAAAPRMGR